MIGRAGRGERGRVDEERKTGARETAMEDRGSGHRGRDRALEREAKMGDEATKLGCVLMSMIRYGSLVRS